MTTHIWGSGAVSVANVWTFTPGGTIGTETFTVTCNGKDLSYTATSGDAVAEVVAGLVAAWNDNTDPAPPEFREAFAYDDGTAMRIVGQTEGKPMTFTSAATGAATLVAAETVAATGQWHVNNVDNFRSGVAIANGDTMIFRSGNIPVLYGLDALDALTTLTIIFEPGYEGQIGLPEENTDGDPYPEYRPRYLQCQGATIQIDAPNMTRCRIDHGTAATTVVGNATGQRETPDLPTVTLIGSHASNAGNFMRGDYGLARIQGETASYPTLRVSYVSNKAGDCQVDCGSGCSLTNVEKTGGLLTIRSNTTSVRQFPEGGTTIFADGAATAILGDGGNLIFNSPDGFTDCDIANDCFLDFDQDTQAKTATNPIVTHGDRWRIRDSRGVLNAGAPVIDLDRNGHYAGFEGPPHRRITLGAIV